jgi:antitoxin ParD1/3/4
MLKLKALREAVRLGIEDIEAGRYKTFHSAEDLERHLAAVAKEARAKRSARGRK